MPKILTPVLLAGLLGATAITLPAQAQTASDFAGQEQHCRALTALAQEETDRLRPEWVQQSRPVAQAGDQVQCRTWYEQANAALQGPQGAEAEAAARIVVTQPDPEVAIQQRAPLVSVTDPEPQVVVSQGQPEIIVRQAAPNVRVQMPPPIITIDQPQPEIIVRMPDPDVAVTNPEPQVEVRMREPVVNVQQGEPQVSVQGQPNTGGSPQIDVQEQEAEIRIERGTGEAQVQVTQQEPSVRYEQAEPNIEIEEQGEPQVQFNQTGEPNIRFEQGGQAGNDSTDNANALLGQNGQAMEAGQPQRYDVSDLTGRPITNLDGQHLGTVDRLVRAGDRFYVVLAEGGFLGFGERDVALPLDAMSVRQGELLLRGMTPQDIEAVPTFTPGSAQPVNNSERVEIGTL